MAYWTNLGEKNESICGARNVGLAGIPAPQRTVREVISDSVLWESMGK
jgi:hypothetical protein